MANRPTIKDVAAAAGVSATTVDRAINGRMTVRKDTLQKIVDAAHRVGYHGKGSLMSQLAENKPRCRLGVVLVKRSQEFYQNFAKEIETAMATQHYVRGEVIIRYAASQSPDDFATELRALGNTVDAIACVAINHQKLDEVVQELKDKGVPVVALLNDTAQGIRKYYIGLNNMKVGRTAAWFLTHTISKPGKLAVFVGGNRWHGHDLREVGFRSYIRAEAPSFTVLDTLVNLETRKVTYEATLDLLHRHSDLTGIYVAGGGMEGAIAALRESRKAGEVSLIVNELTHESRAALADGYVQMVNVTPLPELCSELVKLVTETFDDASEGVAGQSFLEPRVILPEMI
ncbi:LacI family DNA-binding transcriptional regulator [Marivivens aquimaris]|uniref:LacI family DNA-binding transcriptional regulator n=1 Tax=Marivivens aquimaris TaxID=2774876 RepID=UPI00187FC42C|nr:LacI family DNA-binding transcriptional regulator [Marivivens aquimaris]